MTIEETVQKFIENVNAEFGSDLAISRGEDFDGNVAEIAINWPGHGHIYVDAISGEILPKTKLQGGLVDKLQEALTPKPKGDPRPTAKQAARGLEKAFAPKEEHPIARENREADENRRRLQEDLDGDRRSGRASGCSPPAMPSFRWWFEAGDPDNIRKEMRG